MFERIIRYFMPKPMRGKITHPRYHEFRVVISTSLIGLMLMLLFPIPVYFLGKPIIGYLINNVLVVITLLSSRHFAHYRVPMIITALCTYFIIYGWIRDSGLIFSTNVSLLHMYLLCAIWADKRYGWWAICSNLFVFGFLYYQTINGRPDNGDAFYALIMNGLITIFFGGFLAYLQMDQERDRIKINALQDKKINLLDEAVKLRTQQLDTMRDALASDFHDETGNMLSAITRQATLLQKRYDSNKEALPIVESIISNSNNLYHASKDFLWQLNHDSHNPNELFLYLTAYGQHYYNQFDIAFSSLATPFQSGQLSPTAALNIIYIFKEAMTNIIKHAGATEVTFEMFAEPEHMTYRLSDNGQWKKADDSQAHYGLVNMERRCLKNDFSFDIATNNGTSITIRVPLQVIKLI